MPTSGSIPNDPFGSQPEQLFSLKEWMVAISSKLDRMDMKLDTKADITQVQGIDNRVSVLERQYVEGQAESKYLVPQHIRMLEDVGILKEKSAAIDSVATYKRWIWGTAFVSIVSTGTAIAGLFIK